MSHTAVIITVAYAIAVVIGSVIAFMIFRSTLNPPEEDRTETWSRRETAWSSDVAHGVGVYNPDDELRCDAPVRRPAQRAADRRRGGLRARVDVEVAQPRSARRALRMTVTSITSWKSAPQTGGR